MSSTALWVKDFIRPCLDELCAGLKLPARAAYCVFWKENGKLTFVTSPFGAGEKRKAWIF